MSTPLESFNTPQHVQAHLRMLAGLSTQQLDIASHSLNPEIYAQPEWLAALTAIATQHRTFRARILLQQLPSAGLSHPLLLLQQRLSSALQVQQATEPLQAYGLCGNHTALLTFTDEARQEGYYSPNAPAESRAFTRHFTTYWDSYSQPSPHLQRFHL